MNNMIYILGEQIEIEQINQELDIEFKNKIHVKLIKENEFGDMQSTAVIMVIFEIAKDLLSSGLYDILKQSLIIIFRNIRPKKEKQKVQIVLGEKSCQINTNFNLTEEQRKKVVEIIVNEIM